MTVSDLPLVAMLKTRMHWHQERQKILAENVSNADTPGFKPRDLTEPSFGPAGEVRGGTLAVAQTSTNHLSATAARRSKLPCMIQRATHTSMTSTTAAQPISGSASG